MTCIVGIEHDGKVTIGGDTASTSGWDLTNDPDGKVFRVGDYLIGVSGSARFGDVVRYRLAVPEQDQKHSDRKHMAVVFIDAVRKAIGEAGNKVVQEETEYSKGWMLVGYRGRLYSVDSAFHVGTSSMPYSAIGCGQDLALGVMFSADSLAPRRRIKLALEAAACFSAAVAGPFTIKTLPGTTP